MAKELADRLWEEHGIVFIPFFKGTYQPLTVLKVIKGKDKGAHGRIAQLRVWKSGTPLACFEYDKQQELPEVKVISQETSMSVLTERMTDAKATLEAAFGFGGSMQGQGSSSLSAEYDLTFHCRGVDLGELTEFIINLCSPCSSTSWKAITKDTVGILNHTQEAVAVVLEVYYARRVKASAQHGSSGGGGLQASVAGVTAGASGSGSSINKSQLTMDTTTDQPFAFSFVLVNYNPKTKKFDIKDDPTRPEAVRGKSTNQQQTAPQGEVSSYACPEVLEGSEADPAGA